MPGSVADARQSLIAMEDVCQSYKMGDQSLIALNSVSLKVSQGESCAIVGPSGSGKSTLLNIIGLLEQQTSGQFWLDGQDMALVDSDERARLRNRLIGFVFQSFNLLPRLSVLENVELPLLYRGSPRAEARERAHIAVDRLGLGDRIRHRPAELSGGQKQRVAIARALVGEPALILADEPTGNLDASNAQETMSLLLELNRTQAVTLIMVTHDDGLANQLERCLHVQDGRVAEAFRFRESGHS